MTEPRPRRTLLKGVVSVIISVTLLLVLGTRLDTDALRHQLQGARLGWVVGASLLVPLQVLLAAERWRIVCAVLGIPLGRREALRESLLSMALNQVLPSGMGGDAVRVWRQRRHGLGCALRAALVDRALGQLVLIGACAAGMVLGTALPGHAPPVGAGGAIVGVLLVLVAVSLVPLRVPGLGPLLADLRTTLRSPERARLLGLSTVSLGSMLPGFAMCGLAVGMAPGVWLMTAAPLSLLAMGTPLTFGGWGLREATLVGTLPLLSGTPEDALSVSILYGSSVLVGGLLGGALALLMPPPPPGPEPC